MVLPSLRRLEYFAVLADHLHFARAADVLGISQPALSAEIKKLEAEVGSALFVRTPTTALTREGSLLLKDARAVLAGARRFTERAQDIGRGQLGTVVIGTVQSFFQRGLPQVVKELEIERPDLRVRVAEEPTFAQRDRLVSGDIDIACGHQPFDEPELVSWRAVNEPFVLCAPAGWRISTLEDARHRPFVIFRHRSSPYYYSRVISICTLAGLDPDIRHEPSTWAAVVDLVALGLGIALVPAGIARSRRADARVEIHDIDVTGVLSEAWISRRAADDTVVADVCQRLLRAAAQ